MTEETAENVLLEARKEGPWPSDKLPQERQPGTTPWSRVHPMAIGLRLAKQEIAKVLMDSDNLEQLAVSLQEKFATDPALFLLRFEPLLRRYEELSTDGEERRPLRIIVGSAEVEE